VRELHQREFDIYALALPRGHGFGDQPPIGAWLTDDAHGCGIVTQNVNTGILGFIVMRRRQDSVWTITIKEHGFESKEEACACMEPHLKEGCPCEPVPPGVRARSPLHDFEGRTPNEIFKLLVDHAHSRVAWLLNQLYLALPNPDQNWAGDCQTVNFHTRLWEAQLLASFREQGLLVTQPFESPDFHIENRLGGEAWVEAVTANPPVAYSHLNTPPVDPPTEREELFFGAAALRFAKTIGNKLDRRYDKLAHVSGKPFMLAIADFQAPASMIWSREGLIGYLYGEGAQGVEVDGRLLAVPMPRKQLLGPTQFPAGLFADARHTELSAVIFSNACSIAKYNRVLASGLGAPEGIRYTRIGAFFDRTPGALRNIPFCLDVISDEYRKLWPQGYEPWCAELEVFHNPYAKFPVPFELLPEATHWFEENGEKICRSFYKASILWSKTLTTDANKPAPRLEDFQKNPDLGTNVNTLE
jgi:hypothetical protein